jgi:hypothetical protein
MTAPAPTPARPTLKTHGELWLARGLRRFYGWWPRRLEACPPPAFTLYAIAPAAPPKAAQEGRDVAPPGQPPAIPRVVWAYWKGTAPPPLIRHCFAHWHRQCPGYEIRVLDDVSVRTWLPEIPAVLDTVSPAKRADWIRLELLRLHGGIWMDASTLLTAPLDWVLEQQARTPADFVGYYLERHTRDARYPVVENWFMAAPPGSRFIADLQHEFTTQVIHRTGAEYIAHLQQLGVYDDVRQDIDAPDYLTMHLALQFILRTRGGYRLALSRAEDGPFYYHLLGRWRRTPLKLRLLFSLPSGALPPLIKLRAPDRRRLDDYLARGLYLPGSVAGQLLTGAQDLPPR